MLRSQKSARPIHSPGAWPPTGAVDTCCSHHGESARKNVCSAWPPIQQLMPNQPQATSARISAGRFEPAVP